MADHISGPGPDDRVAWEASINRDYDTVTTASGTVLPISMRPAAIEMAFYDLTKEEAKRDAFAPKVPDRSAGVAAAPTIYEGSKDAEYLRMREKERAWARKQAREAEMRAARYAKQSAAETVAQTDRGGSIPAPAPTKTPEPPKLNRFEGLDL
jgi:hypothetical protein